MRARIDINEVEQATKIRAKYLRALENEEWDLLPGPVYVKSFVRTYADYLGLDSRMLTDEFKRRFERPSDHDARPLSAMARDRERAARGPRMPPWVPIAGVLVAVVVVLFFVGTLGSNGGNGKTTPPPTSPTTSTRTTTHHHHAPKTVTTKTTTTPPPPTTVKLQLVPTGSLYVCLVNGTSHHVLIPGLLYAAGETIPTKRAPSLLLPLGNASVDMKVNGKHVAVQPSSGPINLKITPSGVKPIPTGPTC
jgi:cytoskeletal protein RodZ